MFYLSYTFSLNCDYNPNLFRYFRRCKNKKIELNVKQKKIKNENENPKKESFNDPNN